MAPREIFDKACDPANPKKIEYAEIVQAAVNIKPFVIRTPCLPSYYKEFGIKLYFKQENLQYTGSFKERGIMNALLKLTCEKRKLGVALGSLGNAGDAAAHMASKLNIPVVVVMPTTVPISRLQRCCSFGAKVVVQGGDLFEAKKYAQTLAKEQGLTYIDSRDHPDLLHGHGSVALEILEDVPKVDAVLVPVATGGLIAAVATVIKHKKPNCLVYGVQPENAQFFSKFLADPRCCLTVEAGHTMADALNVNIVGLNSYNYNKSNLDKMVLVKEDWIALAMLHMYDRERLVVEGAGACALAAVMGETLPELKGKTVVAIVSGGNTDLAAFSRSLERAMAAEGTLVKFKVSIRDATVSQAELFRLLQKGGYTLIHEFQMHRWTNHDQYRMEVTLCARCKNLKHALQMKQCLELKYPCTVTFETEPFSDKRKCPCYAHAAADKNAKGCSQNPNCAPYIFSKIYKN